MTKKISVFASNSLLFFVVVLFQMCFETNMIETIVITIICYKYVKS